MRSPHFLRFRRRNIWLILFMTYSFIHTIIIFYTISANNELNLFLRSVIMILDIYFLFIFLSLSRLATGNAVSAGE